MTFYDARAARPLQGRRAPVLERTGVRFGSPKALDILEEHGAQVDRASGVVRFAPDLVTARAREGAAQLLARLARR